MEHWGCWRDSGRFASTKQKRIYSGRTEIFQEGESALAKCGRLIVATCNNLPYKVRYDPPNSTSNNASSAFVAGIQEAYSHSYSLSVRIGRFLRENFSSLGKNGSTMDNMCFVWSMVVACSKLTIRKFKNLILFPSCAVMSNIVFILFLTRMYRSLEIDRIKTSSILERRRRR